MERLGTVIGAFVTGLPLKVTPSPRRRIQSLLKKIWDISYSLTILISSVYRIANFTNS